MHARSHAATPTLPLPHATCQGPEPAAFSGGAEEEEAEEAEEEEGGLEVVLLIGFPSVEVEMIRENAESLFPLGELGLEGPPPVVLAVGRSGSQRRLTELEAVAREAYEGVDGEWWRLALFNAGCRGVEEITCLRFRT